MPIKTQSDHDPKAIPETTPSGIFGDGWESRHNHEIWGSRPDGTVEIGPTTLPETALEPAAPATPKKPAQSLKGDHKIDVA